jgi:hypothetical protein
MLGKIDRFRAVLAQAEGTAGLIRLNLFFYVAVPGAYLAVLRISGIGPMMLGALTLKFACTAFLDIRAERRIVAGGDYSSRQHALSRCDNALNLAVAALVLYALLKPAG